MPDSGYQAQMPGPSVRPGPINLQVDAIEHSHNASLREEPTGKWWLAWTVIVAGTFGVAVWSTVIYGIWGSLS